MTKKFIFTVITLAMLASVFVYAQASAQTFCPWDVRFDAVYDGDVCSYRLSDKISACADQAEQREFYSGAQQKMHLYRRLLQMGLPFDAICNYILPDFMSVVRHFEYVEQTRRDARVNFSAKGFEYEREQNGVHIDVRKLFETALTSRGKTININLPVVTDQAVTVRQLKQNTVLKASFSTSFNAANANRTYNIRKAVASINGTTVQAGQTFSFNDTVGERTLQTGYKNAKVILNGNYADGVGGGVCQVSTTLYNALLLAEFLPQAVAHSLVSSYVKAGFDAMVSYGAADLTFTNDSEFPVYIAAHVYDGVVRFDIYGKPNKYFVERVSSEKRDKFQTVVVNDPVKYPQLVYADQTQIITPGSDGVESKSYLNYYADGKLVKTLLIRANKYKRVDMVVARGTLPRENDLLP